MEKKQCTQCEAFRYIDEFELHKSNSNGKTYRKNICKPCGLENHANAEARRRMRIKFSDAKKRAGYEAVVDIIMADKELMASVIRRNPQRYNDAVNRAFARNVDKIRDLFLNRTGGFKARYFEREVLLDEMEREYNVIR